MAVFTLHSAPLTFSGSVSGTAAEDFAGRCGSMITVNATGSGSSNLLGAFSDTQSHCDTSFITFGNGLFTLVSQAIPANTLSGTYNGSAAIGTGGALTFSAILSVNGGSGQFANYAGTLNSNGLLIPLAVSRPTSPAKSIPSPSPPLSCCYLSVQPSRWGTCFTAASESLGAQPSTRAIPSQLKQSLLNRSRSDLR